MNKKILRYLLIAIAAAFLGPLIINWLYQAENPIFITEWDAVDVLEYYGTILSAIISVLVILITITSEHEKIAIERLEEKERIKEQRHYDSIMNILDKVSSSIMENLLHLNPNRLYDIYYGYSLSYKPDIKWLIDLRNAGHEYLTRTDWLVNDYRRIDELSCYGIDESELLEICVLFNKLYSSYIKAHNNLMEIGSELVERKATVNSTDFNVAYRKIADQYGENTMIYETISSKSGKLIQNIRIQIMQNQTRNKNEKTE